MKLTASQKQDIVTKIKHSNTFSNARTSSALLQYLHDSTLKGSNLKEEVINMEFYGEKEFTDKNNPRVRVNVYNLRKKLSIYYEEEGKEDKWELSIDKGQYRVSFTKRSTGLRLLEHFTWQKTTPYLALIIAVLIIIFTNIAPRPHKIWRSFLSSKNQTIVYVGDVFGTVGKTITGRKGWTRDYGINNVSEFYDYINDKPELKESLKPSSFSFTTSMAVISIKMFQQYFQQHDSDFSIRFSTRSSTS